MNEDVLDGVKLIGSVNTDDDVLFDNIKSAVRRGHPQIRPQPLQPDRVALVCSGPSLNDTVSELRDSVAAGMKVVTVNGSYQWCLDRNIVPSMQIVMDARETNARFLSPSLPRCHYALASQTHPSLWDAVEGRQNVWIYHVGVNDETNRTKQFLDEFYRKNWHGIGGGTTVGTRAIALLRTLGYLRFDVFGMDSCWMADQHHAFHQIENERDTRYRFSVYPVGHPEMSRVFECAPWHVQQLQDFLQMIRFNGNQFVLRLHGDGLLAYVLRSAADVVIAETD